MTTYNFKEHVARKCMVLISKHFINNKTMNEAKFWEILAIVTKELKEKSK